MSNRFPKFQPSRLLALPHVQTLGAFLFPGIQKHGNVGVAESCSSKLQRTVELHDGDHLVIHDDCPQGWQTGDRIVILLHGFCGDHRSPYVVRLANKLNQNKIRSIRVDFRGFGLSTYVSRSHLYAGCSHDVADVVSDVHEMHPSSNISLVGFSIGGNILLKLLGEWGNDFPQFIESAVAVSPPIDLVYASWNIRNRGNQIYEAYFVKRLRESMTTRRRCVPNLLDTGVNPLPRRLQHWDEQLTAPIWGFRNAQDYYQQCSAGPLLKNVRVPTKILWSEDDPMVPFDSIERFTVSNQIELMETKRGGHLGFLNQRKTADPDRYWMDWRILEWILEHDRAGEDQALSDQAPSQAVFADSQPSFLTLG